MNSIPRILILSKGSYDEMSSESREWKKFLNCLEYGYSILSTSSTSKALNLLKEEMFDAFFVDYTMVTRRSELILEAYHNWSQSHPPENLINADILIVGISKSSWKCIETTDLSMIIKNDLLKSMAPLTPREDEDDADDAYVNRLVLSSQSSSVVKTLAMIDLVVGNPMDNINMIMELLDQKQHHVSLPTLLDQLDHDPRYQRYRPRFPSSYEDSSPRLPYSWSSDDVTSPALRTPVPLLSLASVANTAMSHRDDDHVANLMDNYHDQDDVKVKRSDTIYPRASIKAVTAKSVFKRSSRKSKSSSSSNSKIRMVLVAAISSPRWIEDKIRGALSPRSISLNLPSTTLFTGIPITSPRKVYPYDFVKIEGKLK